MSFSIFNEEIKLFLLCFLFATDYMNLIGYFQQSYYKFFEMVRIYKITTNERSFHHTKELFNPFTTIRILHPIKCWNKWPKHHNILYSNPRKFLTYLSSFTYGKVVRERRNENQKYKNNDFFHAINYTNTKGKLMASIIALLLIPQKMDNKKDLNYTWINILKIT